MLKKFFSVLIQHKFITFIIVVVIFGGGYYFYKKNNNTSDVTKYVLTTVEKGNILTTVTGTGQVSASNQVEVKSEVSGKVISLSIKTGQEVKAGELLAQIDATDAIKTVRDAATALETAKLELEEALKPTDELTLLQAEGALIDAEQNKKDAEDNLVKSYEDGFNAVSNAFLELPNIISGLRDILYSYSYNQNQNNMDYYADAAKYFDTKILTYRDDAKAAYEQARLAYDANFSDYKATSRSSDTATIESLVNQTYETVRLISEATKSANNLIQFYQDKFTSRGLTPQSLATTQLTSLSSYSSKTNTHLSNLLTAKNAIPGYKDAIVSAERSIKEKKLSLQDAKAGTDELTIRAKKIAVQQKEDALTSAKETLADYSIRAPFAGVIASVDIQKGDSISNGTIAATLITKQRIAEISLNEVDAAKIKIGQKVTLTFDAVEDLTLTGEVSEVNTLGTVSQGVVSYTIKIAFDTQDERIKPGMSTSATIITEIKQDILIIPSSAIKTLGNSSYVELPDESLPANYNVTTGVILTQTPRQQTIETGIANDTTTEVKSGLNEGDTIIARTITTSGSANNTTSSSGSSSGNQNTIRVPDMVGGFRD